MSSNEHNNMIIHLFAGGIAGTTGAILTSPFEVVKVRFQADSKSLRKHSGAASSKACSNVQTSAAPSPGSTLARSATTTKPCYVNRVLALSRNGRGSASPSSHHYFSSNGLNFELNHSQLNAATAESSTPFIPQRSFTSSQPFGRSILYKLKSIVENEGFRALFKGLGPNIIGVAPYRAIYFFSYANTKNVLLDYTSEEGPIVHIGSAFMAGFSAVTITNPIWFVKTRLQVDESRRGTTALKVISKIWKEKGLLGFYKGISASYFGITESALYFVIYEKLKSISFANNECKDSLPLSCYLTSAGFSKTLASCICYPHEVARTRLRLEGNKYHGFFQTLNLIIVEEGFRGMYKGMATHLIRQIPNTAIVMTTYELIINYWNMASKASNYKIIDDDDSN